PSVITVIRGCTVRLPCSATSALAGSARPPPGSFHRPAPSRVALLDIIIVSRLELAVELPVRGHLVLRGPQPFSQAGQVGSAEGGGLEHPRSPDGNAKEIRLHLEHQVHGAGAAVRLELGDG